MKQGCDKHKLGPYHKCRRMPKVERTTSKGKTFHLCIHCDAIKINGKTIGQILEQ